MRWAFLAGDWTDRIESCERVDGRCDGDGMACADCSLSLSDDAAAALPNPTTSTSATAPAVPLTAASIKFSFGGDDPDEEDEEEEEGEAEEDKEDDLESAFLMLDTARAIWEKVDSREAREKVAEAHKLLGEVATESGLSSLSFRVRRFE